jgi:hypothetical protein
MFPIFLFTILFPKNLCMPPPIPIEAITTKIDMKESVAEDVPIIEGEVIFDKINQYTYPENIVAIASM